MSILFIVTLRNEELISCNNGDPRQRDQSLKVNKDNFKIAVGLTEDKARALYRKHFKNFYDFDIIQSNLTQGQAYTIKKEIREALKDKLIIHNDRSNDWMYRKDYDYAMKVIDGYRKDGYRKT